MTEKTRTCFVVMGYDRKTDPNTSKVYDLDKSYRSVIKEAVKQAGFEPIRSDKVTESGMISRQMYQLLMDAELVVCDLTTLNPNALYELGIRMALRPRGTVVIAAEGTQIPFNLNQARFFWYKHGGEAIDYEDATAAQHALTEACRAAAACDEPDSLLYSLFKNELDPPRWRGDEAAASARSTELARCPDSVSSNPSLRTQREFVVVARRNKHWAEAIERLKELHEKANQENRPIEPWFTQQWALVTYKQRESGDSSNLDDLLAAREILLRLDPPNSNDTETLGLWAAIHKRLSEHADRDMRSRQRDLGLAIASYRKGYILRDDHYNGANYAFLLLYRAVNLPSDDDRRNVRDIVEATDTWMHIVELCQSILDKPLPRAQKLEVEHRDQLEGQFWQTASLAQSLLALGDDQYRVTRKRLEVLHGILGEDWMVATTDKQESALRQLLGHKSYVRLSSYPLSA